MIFTGVKMIGIYNKIPIVFYPSFDLRHGFVVVSKNIERINKITQKLMKLCYLMYFANIF